MSRTEACEHSGSIEELKAWLAREEADEAEHLDMIKELRDRAAAVAAGEIAKVIDAKVEQKVWEQSEAQAKEQWKQCANLKLDKNGDPIEVGNIGGVQQAKERMDYHWPITNQTPTIGWSCPNCGRCFAPHVTSCSVCIGMQYWPHPGGMAPTTWPSPWWQAPPQSPWTYGTVTVPTYAASGPGGSGPSSGTYDCNEYQTRLDG